jgi:hypothetical protein
MAISRLKMTANSTRWKAINPKNDLPVLFDSLQKITL